MKLIERIGAVEFSDAEKDRIGRALLDAQSAPARVFRAEAPEIHDPEFWGHAQQKFRINGFRPGARKAVESIVARVLATPKAHFSEKPNGDWPLIWVPYRRCVFLHLEHELPSLYDLIRSESAKPSAGSGTEQILRGILRALPFHSASVEQVRDLYELWGFERTTQFEDLLANNWVDSEAARRMVDDGVRTMGRKLAASLEEARKDTQRGLSEQGRELASVNASMTEMREDLADLAAIVKAAASTSSGVNLSSGRALVAGGVPSWPAVNRRLAEPMSEHVNRSLEDLQSRTESLGRQLKEVRQRIERVEPQNFETTWPNTPKSSASESAIARFATRSELLAARTSKTSRRHARLIPMPSVEQSLGCPARGWTPELLRGRK